MSRRRRFILWSISIVVVAVLGGLIAASRYLPTLLIAKLQTAVKQSCRTCDIEIGSAEIDLFRPGGVQLNSLQFSGGYAGACEVKVEAQSISSRVDLWELSKGHLELGPISIQDPVVTVIDGDNRSPAGSSEGSDISVTLDTVTVSNGALVFVRNNHGQHATLDLDKIEAELAAIGDFPPPLDKPVSAKATTRIEGSGQIELAVSTFLRAGPEHVDVELRIKNYDLSQLSKFFVPNAGVRLEGTMLEGHGTVHTRGQSEHVVVTTTYENLTIELGRDADRSGFMAFFENIGMSLVVSSQNRDASQSESTRAIDLERNSNEPLVGFILRGLKEAAFKVAKNG